MQRMPPPPFPCLVLAHYHSVHQLLRQCFISLREEQRGWGRSCLLLCGCPEMRRDQRVGTSPRALNSELCGFAAWPNPSLCTTRFAVTAELGASPSCGQPRGVTAGPGGRRWPQHSGRVPVPSGQQGALPLAEPQCQAERRGRHGAAVQDLRGGHRGEPQEAFHG